MKVRGIVLAGGLGSRLWPLTVAASKQILPIYDKPTIYYPLSTLMNAGIREVRILSTPRHINDFRELLGDGSDWGLTLTYQVQEQPRGIADAFILAGSFVGDQAVALILGDNLFHGPGLGRRLSTLSEPAGAHVFAYEVAEPSHYGVIQLGDDGSVLSIEEKPERPRSNLAVPGLYFYGPDVVEVARNLRPSPRGELEITDLNLIYLREGRLTATKLERGSVWLDTGTIASLLDAGEYVRMIETRQGLKLGCPEEVAWRNGWISDQDLIRLARDGKASGYGDYLLSLLGRSRA